MKHNKKRNTAFLYESLVKELTKAIVNEDTERKVKIIGIIKENFKKGSSLKADLEIYKNLLDSDPLEEEFAKRFMFEVKKDYLFLDRKKVFNAQTNLLKQISESLSNKIFANFISNYRDIASIGQFLNSHKSKPKARLIIEDKIVKILTDKLELNEDRIQHIDKLTYKTFINKFNDTYGNCLRKEQKDLLTNYIISFTDNGLNLKIFLNEEVGRLKDEIQKCLSTKIITENESYRKNTESVLEKLNKFVENPINEEMIHEIFFIQNLVMEISKDAN